VHWDFVFLSQSPGLIDIHVHVYTVTGERGYFPGDNSVYPDGFTFRLGVPRSPMPGARDGEISRTSNSELSIDGGLECRPTAEMALRHKGLIIGVKTAQYTGPDWTTCRTRRRSGNDSEYPDFGTDHAERPVSELVTRDAKNLIPLTESSRRA
jgi:dihydroorotase